MLYDHCLQRPDTFDLNVHSTMARELLFADLGRFVSTTHCHDSSLHGNHGTLTNMDPATDWVWSEELGRWGAALGNAQHIPTATTITLTTWTIALHANVSSFASGWSIPIGDRTNSFFARYYNGTTRQFRVSCEGTVIDSDSGGLAPTGVREHWAVTYDGVAARFFINGIQAGSAKSSAGRTFQITNVGNGLATYYSTHTQWDVLVLSRAFSPSEIQQLADPSNVMLSGLILPPARRLWPVAAISDGAGLDLAHHGGMLAM